MLTGMMIWQHFLGRREFDCVIDHMAAVYIIRGKDQPKTKRIENLLEKLQGWNFVVYYVKGKDLKIADWMSRADIKDDDDPRIVVPVSVTIDDLLPSTEDPRCIDKENPNTIFYKPQDWMKQREKSLNTPTVYIVEPDKEKLYVVTRSKGQKLPEVHGINKGVNPDLKPEKQAQRRVTNPTRRTTTTPNRPETPNPIPSTTTATRRQTPIETEEVTTNRKRPWTPRPAQESRKRIITPEPTPTRPKMKITIGSRIAESHTQNREFDLDGPEKFEDITTEIGLPEDKHFQVPISLAETADLTKTIHKHLPKQVDIDKLLKQIEHKILRQTEFPEGLKDIKAHYLKSPHFQNIYNYLETGKSPKKRQAIEQLHRDLPNYFILDNLLFRITLPTKKDPKAYLCIPTSMVDTLLFWYHSSKLGAHMGVTKCIQTISSKFYCPDLARHARAYIMSCHVCQMFKTQQGQKYQQAHRVNIDTEALTKFSMDIKHMPRGEGGFKYILVLYCEISNYLIAQPMRTTQAEEICTNIITGCIRYFSVPTHIICDQDPAFLASISQEMYRQCGTKVVTVGPTNHKSLKAEAGIKSLANILMKHLSGFGTEWPSFIPWAMLNHNTFNTPNLTGYSPMHIAIGKEPNLCPDMEVKTDIKVSSSYKEYHEKLKRQLKYMREQLQKHRTRRTQLANQGKSIKTYAEGQIVYLYNPAGARLQTGSRKICCKFIGPLVIYQCLSDTQFLVMSLDGKLYPYVIEVTRLKPGFIQTAKGAVSTLAELKSVLTVNV